LFWRCNVTRTASYMLVFHGRHRFTPALWPWCKTSWTMRPTQAVHRLANRQQGFVRTRSGFKFWPNLGVTLALPVPRATSVHCVRLATMSGATSSSSETSDSYRLPTNVKPTHYKVTIRTDLEKLEFDGFVRVQ
jgi:hypothetical protein